MTNICRSINFSLFPVYFVNSIIVNNCNINLTSIRALYKINCLANYFVNYICIINIYFLSYSFSMYIFIFYSFAISFSNGFHYIVTLSFFPLTCFIRISVAHFPVIFFISFYNLLYKRMSYYIVII